MNTYLVCYDISDNGARARMACTLLDFGLRIQESVFQCLLTEDRFDHLMTHVRAVRLQPTDRVRVYRLCRRCQSTGIVFGAVPAREPDFYLV